MKSILQEGSSVAKAVEKALQIADYPREFTVKVLEEPQKNFFGMTTKSAKISFLFDTEKALKTEKPRVEKRHKPEKIIKQHVLKSEKPEKVKKTIQDSPIFWTENMVQMVRNWLKSTLEKMEHPGINFKTDINRYYLRITFAQPLHKDEEKERQIFRSFSYLILQSLRTKLQRPLRGFKVVLTRG